MPDTSNIRRVCVFCGASHGGRPEYAAAAFELAGRAVEMGYDLRAVCRELSRVVRDLLVLTVDSSRISDPEIAGETERDRLKTLAARFSRRWNQMAPRKPHSAPTAPSLRLLTKVDGPRFGTFNRERPNGWNIPPM